MPFVNRLYLFVKGAVYGKIVVTSFFDSAANSFVVDKGHYTPVVNGPEAR